MLKLKLSELDIQTRHAFLLSSVGPRPIALVSTISKDGVPNVSPFSFFNIFSSNPPIAIFSPSRRGRDASTKDTYNNIKEVPELVINIVNYDIIDQVNLSSTEYDKDIDEFKKAAFTPLPSDLVKAFRVKESPVQMECKVKQVIELGDKRAAGNLIICEILIMHIDKKILNEKGLIDQKKINLVGRLGANFYSKCDDNSLFELPYSRNKINIGFDNLPLWIRNSKIFSTSELAKLALIEKLPQKILDSKREGKIIWKNVNKIKNYLSNNEIEKAWQEITKLL